MSGEKKQVQLFDPIYLDEMLELSGPMGSVHVRKIIDAYLRGIDQYLEKIHAARAANRAEELRKAVHGLGGSSGTVGANAVHRICYELEDALDEGAGVEAWDQRESTIDRYVPATKEALVKYREKLAE